jgi:hypothetical protein
VAGPASRPRAAGPTRLRLGDHPSRKATPVSFGYSLRVARDGKRVGQKRIVVIGSKENTSMTTVDLEPLTVAVPLWEDPPGVFRVGKSRVLLELVLGAFKQGETPEGLPRRCPLRRADSGMAAGRGASSGVGRTPPDTAGFPPPRRPVILNKEPRRNTRSLVIPPLCRFSSSLDRFSVVQCRWSYAF